MVDKMTGSSDTLARKRKPALSLSLSFLTVSCSNYLCHNKVSSSRLEYPVQELKLYNLPRSSALSLHYVTLVQLRFGI